MSGMVNDGDDGELTVTFHLLGEDRIDRQTGGDADPVFRRSLIKAGGAEHAVPLSAVGAFKVRHILNDAENGDVHKPCHINGLLDDDADHLLRARNDHDAVNREALENGERYVARSGRHIDEHIINIAPVYVRPELTNNSGNDRAAPYYGVRGLIEEKIHTHKLYPGRGLNGEESGFRSGGTLPYAELGWNGGAGYIRIEHGNGVAAPSHADGGESGDEALADAALAGNDRDDLSDIAALMGLL